jgi:ribosomal-protein-alanine N-acetyltransferase
VSAAASNVTSAALLPGAPRLPTVECGRVRLRALTRDDVPALYAIFADPEVARYASRPPMASEAEAADYLASIERGFVERTLYQWGMERVEDGRVVGTMTLAHVDAAHARAEVGYMLGREHWGQGYLTEVLPAAVRFAFESLGLHRLEADADPRNAASVRALERVGFRREGYQRARYLQLGEWQDAVLYGLLRGEWAAGGRAEWRGEDTALGMLRHALATLAYRAGKTLRGAPAEFAALRVAPDTRTPGQILAHMGDLMDWAVHMARGEHTWRDSAPLPWDAECARFFAAVQAFDDALARGAPLDAGLAERLFQGPVADALTHTGQLAMLRRMAGGPVRGENYARAEIAAGRVGAEQAAPRVEFG